MSLASEIAASIQRITLDVRVNGAAVSEVVEASVSMGFDQANAQATLTCRARPSWADEGQAVEVWAGYNGQTAIVFRGELSGISWEDGPGRVNFDCRDYLARTRLPWGGDDVEEVNIDSAAMVRHILEIYGIPSSVAHIEGSGWELGTINPVTLRQGETGFALIGRIDALEGYRTYTDSAGVIRRMRVTGAPGAGAALAIGTGQLVDRPRRTRTTDGIVNRCVVTGLSLAGITVGGPGVADVSAANPYVPDPPGHVTATIQDDLVEDDATALAIAGRIVGDQNRRPEGLELAIVGDPRVQPAWTVAVTEAALETGGAANTFVQHVAHRITATSFVTTIRTTGGSLSGYVAGLPPTAVFDAQMFLEGEDTGAGVSGIVVGVADGSQSSDPDGAIVSYAWTLSATGATVTPATASGPICRFTVPSAATDLTIALTVTDGDGLTGTLSRTIPITASTLLVEDLYTAEGSMVACSSDGEQTWREAAPASGSATCLMPIAPPWGEVWGTSTGHVYATFDKLVTGLVDLGQPHGAVACTAVWVHEVDPTRLWAGFADGDVWFATVDSAAATATWARGGNVGAGPVRDIRETLAAAGSLRATAGAGYYASEDGGASWALLHTFDTAWRMAAGFDTNLATGLNSTPPVYGEEGTAPTAPGGVTHLRGVTFGWRTKALYAADDAANLYATDATLAALTDTSDNAPAGVNHMIRSGNVDGVIYLACGDGTGSNGFAKWLPATTAPFWVRQTGARAGLMLGYGPAHPPPVAAQLLMLGAGGASGAMGVWRYAGSAWADVSGSLPARGWNGITANPTDPRDWIVWGGDVAYRTTDAGATWTAISAVWTPYHPDDTGSIRGIAYTPDGSAWAATGIAQNSFLQEVRGFVTLGAGTSGASISYWMADATLFPSEHDRPTSLCYSRTGVLVIGAWDHDDPALGSEWLRASDTHVLASGAAVRRLDATPTGAAVLGVTHAPSGSAGQIWRTADPAAADASQVATCADADANSMLACATDAIYLGTSSGLARMPYTFGSPTTAALAGLPVAWVARDRQTATIVAAIHAGTAAAGAGQGHLAVLSGGGVALVPLPGDVGGLEPDYQTYVEAIGV